MAVPSFSAWSSYGILVEILLKYRDALSHHALCALSLSILSINHLHEKNISLFIFYR